GQMLLLARWYLVALLIHEEALAGARQFWITRPYSWKSLLAAKMLFIAIFVILPAFIADWAILSAGGFHPRTQIPGLLWRQAVMTSVVLLPAVAVAALTRSLAQFGFASCCVVLYSAALVIASYRSEWHTLEWIRSSVATTILL